MDRIMKCAEALSTEAASLADMMDLVLGATEGALQRDGEPATKIKAVNSLNYICARLKAHSEACDKLVRLFYESGNSTEKEDKRV